MKVHRGDKVRIIAGKDKGREGIIDRVYTRQNKVLIMGINMYKKHMKKNEQFPQGGIVELPRSLDASKVMKISDSDKKTTRIGYVLEAGKKFRVERRTGERVKPKKNK